MRVWFQTEGMERLVRAERILSILFCKNKPWGVCFVDKPIVVSFTFATDFFRGLYIM